MPVLFNCERWAQIKEIYNDWWNRKLDRVVVGVAIESKLPHRPEPDVPLLNQATCNDLNVRAEDIVDRIDYELSKYEFYGDAFPMFNMDCFGPGVVAAFLGAKLDNSSGRVWFHPVKEQHISEIHFEYDPENPWLVRIKEIYKAAMERWQGNVLMGMTDLGGVLDILSTFRPGEKLLFDLIDEPDEVKRVIREISELWHRFHMNLLAVLSPVNPGYTDWSTIYSSVPSYIIQSDFSYMLSPEMFKEYILDELSETCKKLPHTMYHLDGKGQLPHLDMLLDIRELDGIQWIPGAGNLPCNQWPGVYRKISQAGKLIQVAWSGFEALEDIIGQIGSPRGLHHPILYFSKNDEEYALNCLKKLGVMK